MKNKTMTNFLILSALLCAIIQPCLGQDQATPPACLLRLDYHYGEINPWLFYEAPLSASVGLLTVWQMSSQGYAQIDIGPAFHLGNLQLIPQVGIDFFESSRHGARIGHVVPEFYVIYATPSINFESWNLYFLKADEEQMTSFYYRDHLVCRAGKWLALGPQVEGYVFPDAKPDHYFGGHVDIEIGVGTFGLFYGQNRDERGVFRMTFLKPF